MTMLCFLCQPKTCLQGKFRTCSVHASFFLLATETSLTTQSSLRVCLCVIACLLGIRETSDTFNRTVHSWNHAQSSTISEPQSQEHAKSIVACRSQVHVHTTYRHVTQTTLQSQLRLKLCCIMLSFDAVITKHNILAALPKSSTIS